MKKVMNCRIDPAKDLVDVWRLLKSSVTLVKWDHPSIANVSEEDMQAYLSRYMLQTPTFFGMISRLGKRPIACVFGNGNLHLVGAPEFYFFVHTVWVEPEFRGSRVMVDLWDDFMRELKKMGHVFWESNTSELLTPRLLRSKNYKIRKLYTRIGGPV